MRLLAILAALILVPAAAEAADRRIPPYATPAQPLWPWTAPPWLRAGDQIEPHRHQRHHHHHHKRVHIAHKPSPVRPSHRAALDTNAQRKTHPGRSLPAGHGLVTVMTVIGLPITVAATVAEKFVGLIASFAEAGYRPRHIGCFAAHGHIRHSLHHTGQACDFDQTDWNKTAPFLYTAQAHALIAAAGLRDGCDFHSRRDCGHVDAGSVRQAIRTKHQNSNRADRENDNRHHRQPKVS
jgi:hypothetical protein